MVWLMHVADNVKHMHGMRRHCFKTPLDRVLHVCALDFGCTFVLKLTLVSVTCREELTSGLSS